MSSPLPNLSPPSAATAVRAWLDGEAGTIENHLNSDLLGVYGPIIPGVESKIRSAVEKLPTRRASLLVVLCTPGGIIETVERIVNVLRTHYPEVRFLVPDYALSAGTVLALSGDAILMDYFSCLGPIDPQVEREDGSLVPALSYLVQAERLIEKSRQGTLTSAELVQLKSLDLAELHKFELAAALSDTLIRQWLTKYKFKNWNVTETRKIPVTKKMKDERASEIARALNDHQRWQSHGRGIGKDVLTLELGLKIDDFSTDQVLKDGVRSYFSCLRDHVQNGKFLSFVHSRAYF
ncbi:MAG: serine dehydrogenasease [Planctomycetia bacterium]|nr:serine dehydrogenasease [Planctomycetia bacterium]